MEINNIEGYLRKNFDKDELKDMRKHGLDLGFSGFIYSQELNKFYDAFCGEIWDVIDEESINYNISVLEFLGQCNGEEKVFSESTFRGFMVYIAIDLILSEMTL